MARKSLLFVGIVLLVVGILIRKLTGLDVFGLLMIITGVICKTVYIVAKARSGEYKPGKELIFLGLGLLLFLSGLYLRSIEQEIINPTYLIVAGLSLKIVFIIRFIQIVRRTEVTTKNSKQNAA